MRTSTSHPLEIGTVAVAPEGGAIGITFCPGKTDPNAATGGCDRDLALDLDAIEAWGAAAVVCLMEAHELDRLGVPGLGQAVTDRYLSWVHLPIPDVSVPAERFERAWRVEGDRLRGLLRSGIPERWVERLAWREEIDAAATKLLAAGAEVRMSRPSDGQEP